MDRYQEREKELCGFRKRIKEDIIAVYNEKGYTGNGIAQFLNIKPDTFQGVKVECGTLYFVTYDDVMWHSDNVTDINLLMTLLRAVHHIIPYRVLD